MSPYCKQGLYLYDIVDRCHAAFLLAFSAREHLPFSTLSILRVLAQSNAGFAKARQRTNDSTIETRMRPRRSNRFPSFYF